MVAKTTQAYRIITESGTNAMAHSFLAIAACNSPVATFRAVLVTQPAFYGHGIDDASYINLETVAVADADGWTQWKLLQRFNAATTEVGNEPGVTVIDVTVKMPKSSRFFYDLIYYNNDGAEQVASIIQEDLSPILETWSPDFCRVHAE